MPASWNCMHCTLMNEGWNPLCEACGSQNPAYKDDKQKRKSILPKVITKPISHVTNAVLDIFSMPSSLNHPGHVVSHATPPSYSIPRHEHNVSDGDFSPEKRASNGVVVPARPPPPRPPPPKHKETPILGSTSMVQLSSDGNRTGMMTDGSRTRSVPEIIDLTRESDYTTVDQAMTNNTENSFRNGSSGSAGGIDYTMRWMCSKCYHQNKLNEAACASCGENRRIGAKGSRARRGASKSQRSNIAMEDMNSSLCSEITSRVEQKSYKGALDTYRNIVSFCLEQKTCFIDDSFPHSMKSIGDLSSTDGDAVVGRVPEDFLWLRPQDIYTKEGRNMSWSVFCDPRAADIEQGTLGDCWLLSALALIAERPDILEHVIVTKQYSPVGVYQIRACMDGEWKVIIVDDFFPCRKKSRSLAFATGRKNQLWVSLIEKALAKHMGSYARLRAGRTIEGLAMLTGAPCELISMEDDGMESDVIWARLLSAREAGFIMGCSCGAGKRPVNSSEFKNKGLLSRHAYSILDVRQEGPYRLLRLRNPWGSFVWKGAWSDSWSHWEPAMKTRLLRSRESGTFWISYEDFCAHFDSVDIAKIRAQTGWAELRVPVQMGGVYRDWDKAIRIVVEKATELTFTLFQSGSRSEKDNVDIMVCVHKVNELGQVGEMVVRSPRRLEAFVTTDDVFLQLGEYVAICHSISTLGTKKINGCLAIHSSRLIFGDTLACPADMYTDSLVQMTLSEGKIHNSLEAVVARYVTRDFAGLLLMMDNLHDSAFLHVKAMCSASMNVICSRGEMDVADIIPPMSRQICVILTHFEPTQNFTVQHQLVTRLTSRSSEELGDMARTGEAAFDHSPPFDSPSVALMHRTKPLLW